jgi:hypothetical protein
MTDPVPQYEGHNLWSLNQLRGDMHLDCERREPVGPARLSRRARVEDFAILVEARDARLGWTVVMRNAENDMIVVLKDARILPVTMFWVSNGGRDFPPWNGRHVPAFWASRMAARRGRGPQGRAGRQPDTGLRRAHTIALGDRHVIPHAILSLPRPPGWSEVTAITLHDDTLTLRDITGDAIAVPFPEEHFA